MNKTNLPEDPRTCGEPVFTQEQLDALRAALAAEHGGGPGLEEKFSQLVEWAVQVCTHYVVLDFMFRGMFAVDIEPDGELRFRALDQGQQTLH
jgi:hypothetical protein